MFEGALFIGVPELILTLLATGVAGAFLYIALQSSWKKKKQDDNVFAHALNEVKHDIGKPISHIFWAVDDLKDKGKKIASSDLDPAESQDYSETVQIITDAAESLQSIVEEAFDSAKKKDPEWARTKDFKAISLNELVDASVSGIERAHGIRISKPVDVDLPTVKGDKTTLQRVFDNLLDNAVLHSGNREEITVELTHGERSGHVTCRVIDKGQGIPANRRRDIFRQGVKFDSDGDGIGLSIVKEIVEKKHKGRIDVESTVGQGTTFIVHLPCAD